jgi:cell division protease FtsH
LKGVLLYGRPGTGKTLIARVKFKLNQCLEQLKGIKFYNSCASDFVEIYVGSGSKKVRELFENARNNKPAIIFIDELEAIGLQRSSNYNNYTNNVERFSTLNQVDLIFT